MSMKLLTPSQDLSIQSAEEDPTVKDLQQEMECPRCSDVMTLSSDFDKLGYICQECDLLLFMQ
jgi:hypothetical protein